MATQRDNEDGSTTLVLEYPVKSTDGSYIDEVTVQRPKVKNLKASDAGKTETEQSVLLIASLTGLRKTEVEDMDMTDFKTVSEVVEGYIRGKQLETGGK